MKRSLVIGACSFFLASLPVLAQVQIRQERVQFQRGESGTTIQNRIEGDQIVDYVLNARAGQSMVVILDTNHLANYFNVTAPGEDSAMFIGSTSGNRFEGELPKDGDYTIRVYLMRSAARRGESANYTIEMGITGDRASNPTAPYTIADYDATTILDCELRNPSDLGEVTHNQDCPAGILRGEAGSASIRVMLPNGTERVLNFDAGDVTTPDGGDLTWGKQSDLWYIGIDNREFYIVPDAAIFGG